MSAHQSIAITRSSAGRSAASRRATDRTFADFLAHALRQGVSKFAKRVGILGSGFGTRVTARALRDEGWDIRGLFSRRAERAREIASKLEIPFHTDDAEALITRDGIDAVVVSTPTSTHHSFVLAALGAGKHVLCEKPFAYDLAEARQMIAAAQASDLTTMCNFEFRYADDRLHLTRLIENGLIGTPQSATATVHFARAMSSAALDWRGELAMGGGALNEHGSHYFDALRGWMGEVTSISARLATHEPARTDLETGTQVQSDADDFVAATLSFASGAIANVSIVWSERVPASGDLYLTGPGGTIHHHSPSGLFGTGTIKHTPPLEMRDGRPEPGQEGPPLALPEEIERLGGEGIVVASRRLLRDFERGIAEGTSPTPNFEDGLRAQLILDGARESARTGELVSIEGGS